MPARGGPGGTGVRHRAVGGCVVRGGPPGRSWSTVQSHGGVSVGGEPRWSGAPTAGAEAAGRLPLPGRAGYRVRVAGTDADRGVAPRVQSGANPQHLLATVLGVGLGRRDLLLALATVLVACGVAASGPIAFVAFLSGPIARILLHGRSSLVAAGLVGACIVVAGDHVGAYLVPDTNLPVGVVTGVLGSPFLLWLLATGRTGRKVRG